MSASNLSIKPVFSDGSLLIVQFGFDKLALSAAVLLLAEFSMDNAYEQRDLVVLWHDLS